MTKAPLRMTIMSDRMFSTGMFVMLIAMILISSAAHGREESGATDVKNLEQRATGHGYVRPTKAQKLASCMDLWDAETHMTRKRWKVVCKRMETKD